MKKYPLGLLAAILLFTPAGIWACDCGDTPVVIHFKDGLTPNGPVTGDAGRANPQGGCTQAFYYRDYGPAIVTPPTVEQPVKRPNS